MCRILLCLAVFLGGMTLQGQSPIDSAVIAENQKRIQKTHINGFYIPQNIEDALATLDEIMDTEAKAKFGAQEEKYAVKNVFFSFGSWLNANWGLLEGSRLSKNLNDLGLRDVDDMVLLLMRTYHRHLNRKPLNVEDQVTHLLARNQDDNHKR